MFSSNSQSGIFYLVSKYYYIDYHRKIFHSNARGHRGHDRMVVRFTTNYAISDLQQVGGFLWVLRFPPPIKLTATI